MAKCRHCHKSTRLAKKDLGSGVHRYGDQCTNPRCVLNEPESSFFTNGF